MSSQPFVVRLVLWVKHQENQVETGQKSMGKLDIFDDGLVLVPLRLDRVRRGKNGGSGIQLADDTSFCH